MIQPLVFLAGLFFAVEGFTNIIYWRNRTSRLWQVGRVIRAIVGCTLIVIAILGD